MTIYFVYCLCDVFGASKVLNDIKNIPFLFSSIAELYVGH